MCRAGCFTTLKMRALLILCIASCCFAQQTLPGVISARFTNNGSCLPPGHSKTSTVSTIQTLLRDTVIPELNRRSCSCENSEEWTTIFSLNMTDPSETCPPNWSLVTTPVRGCGRLGGADPCGSVIFPTNGQSYSRVCGKVTAYQKGETWAFEASLNNNQVNLEGPYIDGVSLTHGAAGSRQHIWSFVTAVYENDPGYDVDWVCPCTNTAVTWPYQVPSYVGDNYFCDTGNPGPGVMDRVVYDSNLLWDGVGCGPTNACCSFNNPPWFCTTLPQATTNDLELRICSSAVPGREDSIINFADIRIM